MNSNIKSPLQTKTRWLITQLVFPSLFLFLSFKSPREKIDLDMPVLKREFKIEKAFQKIRIEGDISVTLTNGPAGSFIVEGKEKELNKIRTVVENNTLILDVSRKAIFRRLTLYLPAASLQAIQLNGNGDITSNELIRSAHLLISLNGNIEVKIKTLGTLSFDAAEDIELVTKSPAITTTDIK
jgi:Putative auto-transporter adhesin, head GIN domain